MPMRKFIKVFVSSVMSATCRAHKRMPSNYTRKDFILMLTTSLKYLSAFMIIVRSKLCPEINVHVVKRFLFDNDKNRYPSDIDVSVFL